MAYVKGGRADKFGNRYEGLWIIKQYLRLLNEEIESIAIEPIGDDEFGIDLWIIDKEGQRLAFQCKARNGSNELWSAGDLNSREIFKKARFQLERNSANSYFFVSAVPAVNINDICIDARNSPDAESFYRYIIKNTSQKEQTFNTICRGFDLDVEKPNDREKAFSCLRRMEFILFPDDSDAKASLLQEISYFIEGNSEDIYSLLFSYALEDNQLGKKISANDLWTYLEKEGHFPRQLDKDTRILPVIKEQQQKFTDSIKGQGLLNKSLIHREEAVQLLQKIKEKIPVILLHGESGCGKSLVLYELTQLLATEGLCFFPLRLDRDDIDCNNLKEVGRKYSLPDSPVMCLAGQTGEKPAVIILDQLDAVRWTRVNGKQSLDICKLIVQQVLHINKMMKQLTVIISCRSFDYQNDPEIRNWLQENKAEEFGITGFAEKQIKEIIGDIEYTTLSHELEKMLSFPQYLKLWLDISHENSMYKNIKSPHHLIEAAWSHYRQKMETEQTIPNDEIVTINNYIVSYCDKNSELSVPKCILDNFSPNTLEALYSYGILEQSDNRIRYTHQSYLDFFIARNIHNNLLSAKETICEWLGNKEKQKPIRRRQLQQVLFLLLEEDPVVFEQTVKDILGSKNIRFSLKHVVLGIIGEYKDFSEDFFSYLRDQLQNPALHEHIVSMVFWGKEFYIKKMIDEGIILQWLTSADQEENTRATRLLFLVAYKIPSIVYELLAPHLNESAEWNKKIKNSLPHEIENDTEDLFMLRLALFKAGMYDDSLFYGIGRLASKNPVGVLQILAVILESWLGDDKTGRIIKGIDPIHWYDKLEDQVLTVAEQIPDKVWNTLVPHITRITGYKPYFDKIWDDEGFHIDYSTEKTCMLLVKHAIYVLAEKNEKTLFEYLQEIIPASSGNIHTIFIYSIFQLPVAYADYCLSVFVNDITGFKQYRTNDPPWELAAQCIAKHSPYCSDTLFRRLEKILISYYEKKIDREFLLWTRNDRLIGRRFLYGIPQYFLLPALTPQRRSRKTDDLIRVLKRRFGEYPDTFLHGNPQFYCGYVRSKLTPNIAKISDSAWLRLIQTPQDHFTKGKWNKVRSISKEILESSIEQFAISHREIAEKEPSRFINLALYFPKETHIDYITAIYQAAALTKPPEKMPEDEKQQWKPAPVASIIKFIEKFPPVNEINNASAFCRLIRNRVEVKYPENILTYLVDFAVNHPDPDSSMKIDKISDLEHIVLNSIRGVAIEAIESLLFSYQELYDFLMPVIEKSVQDKHPAVRTAALEAIRPLFSINEEEAVDYYFRIVNSDLRIAATRYSIDLMNYIIRKYYHRLKPVIVAMIHSDVPHVRETGAQAVAGYNLFYGFFEDVIDECLQSNNDARKGMAYIYATHLTTVSYSEKSMKYLMIFWNDENKEVRGMAARFLYNKHLDIPGIEQFLIDFTNSLAFYDEAEIFLKYLKEKFYNSIHSFALLIFHICDNIVNKNTDSFRQEIPWGHVSGEIFDLLFRLYNENLQKKFEIALKALDYIDLLMEKRIGFPDFLKEWDRL